MNGVRINADHGPLRDKTVSADDLRGEVKGADIRHRTNPQDLLDNRSNVWQVLLVVESGETVVADHGAQLIHRCTA